MARITFASTYSCKIKDNITTKEHDVDYERLKLANEDLGFFNLGFG